MTFIDLLIKFAINDKHAKKALAKKANSNTLFIKVYYINILS